MSIEIGMITIYCDGCTTRLVHDPSPDPISSFTTAPRWSAKDAVVSAIKVGWSIEYNADIGMHWVFCPSCVSEMAAMKFNRQEQGKVIMVGTSERPTHYIRLKERMVQSRDKRGKGGS